MKNWLQYLKLWQKKREEWPVGDDADAGWTGMQSLLDEHMPVDDNEGGAIKKRGFNLFTIMLISLSAAAMVYVTARVVKTKFITAHTVNHYHHKHHGHHAGIDSLADADSLMNDSLTEVRDSINQVKGVSNIDGQKDQLSVSDKTVAKKNLGNVSIAKPEEGSKDDTKRGEPAVKVNSADSKKEKTSASKNAGQNNVNSHQTGAVGNSSTKNNTILAGSGSHGKNYSPRSNNSNIGQNSPIAGNPGTNSIINPSNPFLQNNARALINDPRQIFGVTTVDNPNQKQVSTYIYPALQQAAQAVAPGKAPKTRSTGQSGTSNLEWGALIGVNAPGSFTPKSQNSNFYGSFPVDGFLGIYASYDVSDKLAIGSQLRVLSPSVIKGNYQIPHTIKQDSTSITTYRAQADSRKLYSVQVPIYAAYMVNNVFSFKLGPVISIPTKQFSTAKATDTTYTSLISQSHYDQKLDLGLSGGVSMRYKRLSFDISYLRGLTNHKVSSDSLSYNMHNSQLQFTIGIQIGGKKK